MDKTLGDGGGRGFHDVRIPSLIDTEGEVLLINTRSMH
jgi:hypothetical protein